MCRIFIYRYYVLSYTCYSVISVFTKIMDYFVHTYMCEKKKKSDLKHKLWEDLGDGLLLENVGDGVLVGELRDRLLVGNMGDKLSVLVSSHFGLIFCYKVLPESILSVLSLAADLICVLEVIQPVEMFL